MESTIESTLAVFLASNLIWWLVIYQLRLRKLEKEHMNWYRYESEDLGLVFPNGNTLADYGITIQEIKTNKSYEAYHAP